MKKIFSAYKTDLFDDEYRRRTIDQFQISSGAKNVTVLQ